MKYETSRDMYKRTIRVIRKHGMFFPISLFIKMDKSRTLVLRLKRFNLKSML